MIGNIDVSLSVEVEKGGSEAFTPKITQDSTKQTDKISSFFAKRPSRPESGEAELTKRVKVVPPEAVPAVLPLRAPSPVALSPEEVKAIEARKLEALQRMEAKRLARVCRLEFEQLPADWLEAVEPELSKPYFVRLKEFLQGEWDRSVKIFPPADLIYTWAKCCPLEKVKVVILGQDPYHNDGQAMGMAFSVPRGFKPLPPSLQNIYKELLKEFPDSFKIPGHGDLTGWAQQGVLLLNATLTVKAHEAASHANRGWEQFTDSVIATLNRSRSNLVFLLWGNHAQKKATMIDKSKHLVLTAAHPSPLSASRGFFGCGHFKAVNEYLETHNLDPIDWSQL